MTPETRNALEVVKQLADHNILDFNAYQIERAKINADALSFLIQEIERLDKTVEEFPKRQKGITCHEFPRADGSHYSPTDNQKVGFNSCLDQVTPIFNKMKERIGELEKEVDNLWEQDRSKSDHLHKVLSELIALKGRVDEGKIADLFLNKNHEGAIIRIDLSVAIDGMGQSIFINESQAHSIAAALVRYLKEGE